MQTPLRFARALPLARAGLGVSAAGSEFLAFDSKAWPAAVQIQGKIVAGARGRDRLGENLLVPDGASYKQVKVRLGEIDTPESNSQPYGTHARQTLSDLAYNQPARVVVQDTDRYGRTVGRVYVGGTDVNVEMVRQGAAWVYRQFAKDPSLDRLEAPAKAAKRGLWALPEAQRCPPWDWRKNACPTSASAPAPASPAASAPTAATSGGGFTCAGKRYCREMTSCEEAKFYLTRCGLTTIDGNRDGTPCETLCR